MLYSYTLDSHILSSIVYPILQINEYMLKIFKTITSYYHSLIIKINPELQF